MAAENDLFVIKILKWAVLQMNQLQHNMTDIWQSDNFRPECTQIFLMIVAKMLNKSLTEKNRSD